MSTFTVKWRDDKDKQVSRVHATRVTLHVETGSVVDEALTGNPSFPERWLNAMRVGDEIVLEVSMEYRPMRYRREQ
jgi:hypothetical protein